MKNTSNMNKYWNKIISAHVYNSIWKQTLVLRKRVYCTNIQLSAYDNANIPGLLEGLRAEKRGWMDAEVLNKKNRHALIHTEDRWDRYIYKQKIFFSNDKWDTVKAACTFNQRIALINPSLSQRGMRMSTQFDEFNIVEMKSINWLLIMYRNAMLCTYICNLV